MLEEWDASEREERLRDIQGERSEARALRGAAEEDDALGHGLTWQQRSSAARVTRSQTRPPWPPPRRQGRPKRLPHRASGHALSATRSAPRRAMSLDMTTGAATETSLTRAALSHRGVSTTDTSRRAGRIALDRDPGHRSARTATAPRVAALATTRRAARLAVLRATGGVTEATRPRA